jgi:hypothetical protein
MVHLGASPIADEDHHAAMVLLLLQVQCHVPHIHDAPERPEVVHHWLPTVPCLEWSYAINALRLTPVQHIHSGIHQLALKPSGYGFGLQHAPSGCHHHPVLMLDDMILLWAIRCHVLTMHALSHTVVCELHHGELPSMVGANWLDVCPRLNVLDGSHCTILGRNHNYTHVPAEIIHKQQKVLVTSWRRR